MACLLWLWSGRSGILYLLHTVANHACDSGKSYFLWDISPAVAALHERWTHCSQHHWCSDCPWCPEQASSPFAPGQDQFYISSSWQVFVETPCPSKASSPSTLLFFPLKIFPECLAWIFFAVIVQRHRMLKDYIWINPKVITSELVPRRGAFHLQTAVHDGRGKMPNYLGKDFQTCWVWYMKPSGSLGMG